MATVTTTTTVRSVFSKPSAALSLAVTGTPPTQICDTTQTGSNMYVPNRLVLPTYISPSISVNAPDGSLNYTGAPSSVEWFVNGTAIASYGWTAGTHYTIQSANDATTGRNKGTLVLNVNMAATARVVITCRATYADPRTVQNIVVESRPITLGTTLKAISGLALKTDLPRTIVYNPALDVLEDAEFHATKTSSTVAAADLTRLKASPASYYHKFPIRFMSGGTQLPTTSYTLKLEVVKGSSAAAPTDATLNAVQNIKNDSLELDVRYLPVGDTVYRLTATLKSDTTVSRSFDIKIRRIIPTLTYRMTNTSDLNPAASATRTEGVEVWCGNRLVRNPERICNFTWKSSFTKTGTTAATTKTLGNGPQITYALTATGATATDLNSRSVQTIDISLEATLKGPKTS